MALVSIEKATMAHAGYIAANIRPEDAAEIWASSMQTPLQAMLTGLKYSDEVLVGLVNNQPVCMWGVAGDSFIGKVGIPWMVATKQLDDYAKIFIRRCRAGLLEITKNYDTLVNYVDARNVKTIRWLKYMGFKFETPAEAGGFFKLPFYKFTMRRNENV